MARTKVQSELIATNAISGTIIADGAITSTHLAANCVDSSELVTGSIDTIHIAANQVTATKIVTNGVLTRHISDDQITADKLANSINTDIAAKLPLAGGTMTGTLAMGSNSITSTGTISSGAITAATSLTVNSDANSSLTIKDGGTDAIQLVAGSGDELYIGPNDAYKLRFKTDGNIVMDNGGKLGIGTSSPATGLHVVTAGGTTPFRVQGGANSGVNIMEVGYAGGGAGANFIVDDNGRVGIGTTSPDGLLHVSSGNSGDAIVIIQADEDNDTESDNPQLWFKQDGDYTEGAVRLSDNKLQIINNVNSAGGISFLTGSTLNTGTTDPATGASERMEIRPTGEVHITSAGGPIDPTIKHGGATGDVAKLRLINRSGQSSDKGGLLEMGAITNDGVTRSDVFASVAGLKDNATSGNKAGYMQFSTSNGSTLAEKMRIDSNGIVTKPYQPAFHAYRPTSASSGAYLVFQYAGVNTGSHYSTSNGKFTAPVAGVYMFYWSAIGNSTNDVYRYFLDKNGSRTISGTSNDVHLRIDTSGTGSEYGTNGSRIQILSLSATDYVQIYFQSDGGSSTYTANDYVNFGGHLIG